MAGKEKAFSTFIMRISIAATTISVAAMIVSMSFINGFQEVIANKIFSFWGHIRIQHFEPLKTTIAEETPLKRDSVTENYLKHLDNIESVSTYVTKSAILNANGTIEGVLMKGVSGEYTFNRINSFLTKGHWPNFSDSSYSNEIAISAYTANQLQTDIGRNIFIYFIQSDGSAPRTRKLKVSGIFKTGIDVYDRLYALGDIRLIQRLNGWDQQEIGGYEVVVKDYKKVDSTSSKIYDGLPAGMNSLTLKELSPEIFDWLNLQETNKYILISIMVIVAMINLITCLIIMVLERTSMIALLKSLGAKNGMIQKIFITYGVGICGIGILAGTALGLSVCYLQKLTGFIHLNEEAYYVHVAPVKIELMDVLSISIGTAIVAFLILLIPSAISKKINPSKALRFK
jgi:lipoprotein-releasing system permease protein